MDAPHLTTGLQPDKPIKHCKYHTGKRHSSMCYAELSFLATWHRSTPAACHCDLQPDCELWLASSYPEPQVGMPWRFASPWESRTSLHARRRLHVYLFCITTVKTSKSKPRLSGPAFLKQALRTSNVWWLHRSDLCMPRWQELDLDVRMEAFCSTWQCHPVTMCSKMYVYKGPPLTRSRCSLKCSQDDIQW